MAGRLRILLLSPDTELTAEITRCLPALEDLVYLKAAIAGYPSPIELARLLRLHTPDAILIDFARPDLALQVMNGLNAEAQNVPVVAFNRLVDANLLREAMRAGARDFLSAPFRAEVLRPVFETLHTLVEREPPSFGSTEHIYTFLPSKPGSGATTLALNIAAAMGRTSQNVLLADLDLSCGMIRFLLKVVGNYSVMDAVSRAGTLDEDVWPQLVAHREGIDILDSGPMSPNSFLLPEELRQLIDFARRRYDALCLDLSGNLEQHSLSAMEESREIFLVCTPEPASLQLGKEKLDFLDSRDLKPKTSLLLNRVNQQLGVAAEEVERFLGIPLRWQFGNYYREVQRAVQDGSAAKRDSHLGREAAEFAHTLLDGAAPPTPTRKGLVGWLKGRSEPSTSHTLRLRQSPDSRLSEISVPLG